MPNELSISSVAFPIMESVENPLAEPVLYAISNDRDITEAIINAQLDSMSIRMHGVMEYAQKYYHLGVPEGKHGNTTIISDTALATIIATDLSIPTGVVIDYNIADTMTLEFIILPLLEGRRKYDFNTNTITVYPAGMSVPEGAKVSIYSITEAVNNTDVSIVYLIFKAEVPDPENPGGPPLEEEYLDYFEEIFTPIQDIKLGRIYHVAKYFVLDGLGEPIESYKWWYYDATTEVYPELNPIKENDTDNTFMPVVPIRYNNITLDGAVHQDTPLNITSKQLMRRMGVSFNQMVDFVDSHPNLADIDHAYVMFGIDLQTTKNSSIYYLAEFFDYLSAISYADQYNFIDKLQQSNALATDTYDFSQGLVPATSNDSFNYSDEVDIDVNMVNNTQEISLIEHGLDINITYRYITTSVKSGVIGDVGTATKDMVSIHTPLKQKTLGYTYIDNSTLTLKVQITPTLYKEIVVVGLIHNNQIQGLTHQTTIFNVTTDADNHNFIIPLHYGVSKRVPLFERTKLYEESFQLVINSYVYTELEWYETEVFKIIVIIVAVVLAIWSAGTSLKAAGAAFASAGGVGAGILAVLWLIVIDMVIPSILMTIIMDFIVNAIGGDLAIILSVVLVVVAIAKGDTSKIQMLKYSIPTAQACMAASNALLSAAQRYFEEAIELIQQKMVEFEGEAEKQQAELDKVTELLDTRSMFDPLSLIGIRKEVQFIEESPDSLYNRAIHIKNPGVITLDVIGNYHAMLLQLPS